MHEVVHESEFRLDSSNGGYDWEGWFEMGSPARLFRVALHADPSYPFQSWKRVEMMTDAGWTTIKFGRAPTELNVRIDTADIKLGLGRLRDLRPKLAVAIERAAELARIVRRSAGVS